MRIRRINEGVSVDYIKECFIDLIDKDIAKPLYGWVDEKAQFIGIMIYIEISSDRETCKSNDFRVADTNIDEYIKLNTIESDIIKKVKNCLEKVSIEYSYKIQSKILTGYLMTPRMEGVIKKLTISFEN